MKDESGQRSQRFCFILHPSSFIPPMESAMPLCQGPTRRDFFRAGGASLFGMSMVDFFRARAAAAGKLPAKAKHMILIWMAGGPPHQDMFDMKPDTPPPFGSELKQSK